MSGLTQTSRPRTARDVLYDCRRLVEPTLRTAVDTLPASMRHLAGYQFGWLDEVGQLTESPGGKAIRPALTLLSARAVGGDPVAAVPAAAAVELVHNFSLVHDDVLDEDLTRRHRPTAWAVFGRGAAILGGSALQTLAFDLLATCGHERAEEAMRMLNGGVLDLLDGQTADMAFERRTDVGLPECMRMAKAKTAALMGTACALGGLFGGADPVRTERLRGFGRRLGLAFQFADDLLGIWGDPEVTGKPACSDVQSRKKSLPVVAALTSGTAAGTELAELYQVERPLSARELLRAATLIEQTGARAWSQARAEELRARALADLAAAEPAPAAAADLETIAQLASHRDR